MDTVNSSVSSGNDPHRDGSKDSPTREFSTQTSSDIKVKVEAPSNLSPSEMNMENVATHDDEETDAPRDRKYSVNRLHDMVRERKNSCVEESIKFEASKVKCLKELYEQFITEENEKNKHLILSQRSVDLGIESKTLKVNTNSFNHLRSRSCDNKPLQVWPFSPEIGLVVALKEKHEDLDQTKNTNIVKACDNETTENSKVKIKEIKGCDVIDITPTRIDNSEGVILPDDHKNSFAMNRESIKKHFSQAIESHQVKKDSTKLDKRKTEKLNKNKTVTENVVQNEDVEIVAPADSLSGKLLLISSGPCVEWQGMCLGEYTHHHGRGREAVYRQNGGTFWLYQKTDKYAYVSTSLGSDQAYLRVEAENILLASWQFWDGQSWCEDKELKLFNWNSLQSLPTVCRRITISSKGTGMTYHKDSFGSFNRVDGFYQSGRPVFANKAGKFLTVQNGMTNWGVFDEPRGGKSGGSNVGSPAGTVCPADHEAGQSKRFGMTSWFYRFDGKCIPDQTITVTCDPHTKMLNSKSTTSL
eukprot:GFUD01019113.1.p1 GENE.GFUD01019113.1~~GFUD01019113.1.p1  ORF type:complete len:528 (+),score=143.21 GFUD01019113.1:67-1650(+)